MDSAVRPDDGLTPKGPLPIMRAEYVEIGDNPLEMVLKWMDVDIYDYYHAPLRFETARASYEPDPPGV